MISFEELDSILDDDMWAAQAEELGLPSDASPEDIYDVLVDTDDD